MKKKLSTLLLALMFLTFANSALACVKGKLEKVLPNGKTVELTIDVLNFSTEQIEKFCADAVEPKACQDNAANTVARSIMNANMVGITTTGPVIWSPEMCRKLMEINPIMMFFLIPVAFQCWVFSAFGQPVGQPECK